MPIANRYTCGDVVVAVWAIEETWEQLAAMLGDDALLRHARSFGSEARRAEWLAVRLLLRAVLGSEARIEYMDSGRPMLAGVGGYISISHTRGYAVLAHSPLQPIGIDAEPVTRKVGVARSFVMRDGEHTALAPEIEEKYMLLRWTAYEAVYKLAGGSDYKERLSMPCFAPGPSGFFAVSLQGCRGGNYALSYIFDEGLLLSLCVEGSVVPQIVRL